VADPPGGGLPGAGGTKVRKQARPGVGDAAPSQRPAGGGAVVLRAEDGTIRERSGYVVVRRGKGDKYREVPLNVTARKML